MTVCRTRLKAFLKRLPLIVFGIVVGALVAEAALRLVGYSFPEFYQLDLSRGYSLRPGKEGWYRKEGGSFVRINSDGLRDREHLQAKPADTIRIAIVGDSYAEALQVSQDQAFWSILQNELKGCAAFAGKKIEVINFGVSGYGTAQELITLREQVWKYAPDIVLLAFTTNNDITDNSRALKKADEIPYFVIENGQLVLDDSFKSTKPFILRQTFINRTGRWFKDHSRLVQATIEGHRGLKLLLSSWRDRLSRKEAAKPEGPQENATHIEDLGIDQQIYVEPTSPTWVDAWNVTEALIREMNSEVRSHGAQFVVVTLTNAAQVAPNRKLRQELMKRIGVNNLFYPDFRIQSLAEREGIPAIILAPELQADAEQNNVYLHGFEPDIGNGHWNVTGHRVAGEFIARKLCELVPVK
jgi:hypothetical protein